MFNFLSSGYKKISSRLFVFSVHVKLQSHQFFSYIFKKQKKLLFFALLLCVVAEMAIPRTAHAILFPLMLSGAVLAGIGSTGILGATIGKFSDYLLNALTTLFMGIPLSIAGLFSYLGGELLRQILIISAGDAVYTTNNPAVLAGWLITRNLGNMVIVIALIVIALATILRYEAYAAKKLLPALIVAALLINFSLVICGVVIDVSNITMKYFLLAGQQQGTLATGGILKTSENAAENIINQVVANESPTAFITRFLGYIFYFMVKGIVAFMFVFLFLFRMLALQILVMLSPLAFACVVLPVTRKMVFEKWVGQFIQWCFIGAIAAMFIYIGDNLRGSLALSSTITKSPGLIQLIDFFIPGMFLVMGFMATLQISAMGSSGAIAAGKWVQNKTVGAVKGGVKAAGRYTTNNTGLTRVKENIVDRATRLAERTPILKNFVPAGTANLAAQERLKKNNAEKETAGATPEQREKIGRQALSWRTVSESARNKTTEAINQMVENKEIFNDSISDTERRAMLAFVAKREGKTEIYSKAGPGMAKDDTDKVNELMRTEGLLRPDAERKVTSKAWSKIEIPDIRKMSFGNDNDLIELVANSSAKKLGKTREGLDSGKEAKLKALLPGIQREEMAARAAGDIARADALENAWLEIDTW